MISLQNVQLNFGAREIFSGLNLTLKSNEKIGLIGRNGVGKSTLFKILTKELTPDGGQYSTASDVTIGLLEQDINLDQSQRARDFVMKVYDEALSSLKRMEELEHLLSTEKNEEKIGDLSMEMAEVGAKLAYIQPEKMMASVEKVLKGLGFENDQLDWPISNFSGGWQMRILLAKLLLEEPDYLLLDEPTNHLDIVSIMWLEQYLLEYPGTYIVISHDKRFLDVVSKKIIEIRLGSCQVYSGNYSKYEVDKELQGDIRRKAYENQQKEIQRKERLINKFRAKQSKASFAQSLITELDRMDKIEIENEDAGVMNIRFSEPPRSAEIAVKGVGLSKKFGDNLVFEGVNVQLLRNQRVSLIGQNGQGKSTLVKLLTKKLDATSGEIQIGSNAYLEYFAQDQGEQLDGDRTVLQWMEDHATAENRTKVRSILGAFLFGQEEVDKKIKVLSGGERSRLAMATMLLRTINVLILDEPTNHLDMISKQVLKDALKSYKGALLVISHDRDFLTGLTDETWIIHEGEIKQHLGDVDSFLTEKGFESLMAFEVKNDKSKTIKKEKPVASGMGHDELKKKKRRLSYVERDIEKLEIAQKEMEEKMAQVGFYESEESEIVLKDYEKIKDDIQVLMSEWEELSELIH